MKRPAVFFDRDNTLIVSDGYLGDPSKVQLMQGAADAVARVRALGFLVVVFSNQSGVARGLFDEDAVHGVNARMTDLLLADNPEAVIDRHDFCPFHPDGVVEHYRQDSNLRKPRPGMILAAAEDLDIDLSASWVIGDAPRDIEAGRAAGVRGILLRDPHVPPSPAADDISAITADHVVSSLKEAVDFIEHRTQRTSREKQAAVAAVAPAAPPVAPPAPLAQTTAAVATVTASTTAAPPPVVAPPKVEPAPAITTTTTAPKIESPPVRQDAAPAQVAAAAQRSVSAQSAAPAQTTAPPVRTAPPADPRTPAVVKKPDPKAPANRTEALLEQILLEMRRRNEQGVTDFSASKLIAGIVQTIALALLFVAYLKRDDPALQPTLMVSLILQTFTIALLIMSRQK